MKAISIGGKVEVFSDLPDTWGKHINFSRASEDLLKEEGFYDLVEPEISGTEKLGSIYFDPENEVFTYLVEDKDPVELAGWAYPERPFRFIVPLDLLFSDNIWSAFAIYADRKRIPFEELPGDNFRYYAQEILPTHEFLLIQAGIQVETIPGYNNNLKSKKASSPSGKPGSFWTRFVTYLKSIFQ